MTPDQFLAVGLLQEESLCIQLPWFSDPLQIRITVRRFSLNSLAIRLLDQPAWCFARIASSIGSGIRPLEGRRCD
jgi:hypothetical protein